MSKEKFKNKLQPMYPEREVEPQPIRREEHLNNLEKKIEPHPMIKEEHPANHKHIHEGLESHLLPSPAEIEIMINLCGNKREIIDVLSHINYLIVDSPKEIRGEIKVKKLK